VLVSNAQSLFTRPELKLLGLDKLLDCTFLSSEEGFKKPDKRFYQAALYKSGADPTRTLMVGNDARCDIEGAVEAGLRAAYFRTDISPASDPVRPQQASFAFKGADYDALAAALGI
jgi:putative hydrolase of the HAD superfamily